MSRSGFSKSGFAARLAVGVPTALVWALAAGSAVFWALQAGAGAPVPAAPSADAAARMAWQPDGQAVARSLGLEVGGQPTASVAQAPAPDELKRLSLQGVLTHGAGGAALLALDGGPARTVRVGAVVDGLAEAWRLESVAPHAVVLARNGVQQRLEMPPMAERSVAGDAQAPGLPVVGTDGAAGVNAAAAARAQAQARAMAARQRGASR